MPSIISIPDSRTLDSTNCIFTNPSLCEDNEYIPIHAMKDGELTINEITGQKSFFYGFIVPEHIVCNYTRKFSDFAANMSKHGLYWCRLNHLSVRGSNGIYYSNNGILLYKNTVSNIVTPLIIMTVRKRYLYSVDVNNIDDSQFCLLIDKKLSAEDSPHYNVYRNIKKYYINTIEKSVDYLYSSDIMKLCYNEVILKLPITNTVTEMIEEMNSINDL